MQGTQNVMKYTERRKGVATLYLEGWRQTDLAERFGVDQSTISRDLAAIRQEWLDSAVVDFNEAKARELARIDKLEREYWEQYEASKEPLESTVKEQTGVGDDKRVKAQKRETSRTGDPRYLAGIQWCIEQRLKIYGVYAAVKTDVTSGGEKLAGPTIYLPQVEEDGE
jgi:transcriptional regulator with XRE-family HTH domain